MNFKSIREWATVIVGSTALLGMAWGGVELISPALNRIQNPPKQELAMCDWYKNQTIVECRKNTTYQETCLEAVQRSYDACIARYGR